MSCFGRQRVVSVESVIIMVRERRASGMSRAGVEALGLLRCDVRELRHIGICGAVVLCGRGVSGWLVAAHYLPALDRLRGCPEGSCWIAPVLRRRPVELSRCLTRRRARRWRVAQPSFCTLRTQPVKRASGFRARRTRVRPDTDLSTARPGPVGAPVLPPSVRVGQIGCFAIWAFSSPQGAAAGAQPRRRNLSRPQLPPCEVSCRAAARKALLGSLPP